MKPDDHHPRRPKWIDTPTQKCDAHPESEVHWRCRFCARNLCAKCMGPGDAMACMYCGALISARQI